MHTYRFRSTSSVYHNSIFGLIAGGKNEPESPHRGPDGISTSALKATCQVCSDRLKIASLREKLQKDEGKCRPVNQFWSTSRRSTILSGILQLSDWKMKLIQSILEIWWYLPRLRVCT